MEGKEQNSIYTINLSLRSTNANITEEEKEDTYGFGFIGTIDGFINLANEIKPIKTKSLDELFEKKTYKGDNNTSPNLNVRYKSKNVNNSMFKATDGSSTLDIFLPVVFDEKIEQSIEECEKYNKLMWKKYRNGIADQDKSSEVYRTHKTDFENSSYIVENFKYQCEFYDRLIDKFIDEEHLIPPEKKRAASVFFYMLTVIAIVFFGFSIFAPELLVAFIIQFSASFGITTEIAYQAYTLLIFFAPMLALLFFKLARYISWRQNNYEENTNPKLYSKYNENLKRHKIWCSMLTGERFETEYYQYNYNEKEAQDCPLYWYYHDKNAKLKKNTKTPLELLLDLKKAYEIPKQFKNIESKAYVQEINKQTNKC